MSRALDFRKWHGEKKKRKSGFCVSQQDLQILENGGGGRGVGDDEVKWWLFTGVVIMMMMAFIRNAADMRKRI